MNKLFTRIAKFTLGLAMAIGVGAGIGFSSGGISQAWAEGNETVTYKVSGFTAVTKTGTAPQGSSATYSQTYTSTAGQMTKDNSITLTIKGFENNIVTGITMSMKSNASSGTGKFSFLAGTTKLAGIDSNTGFNQPAWHGSWSNTYVDVTPSMIDANHTITIGENLVLSISASQNSLFFESITLTYRDASTPVPQTLPEGDYYLKLLPADFGTSYDTTESIFKAKIFDSNNNFTLVETKLSRIQIMNQEGKIQFKKKLGVVKSSEDLPGEISSIVCTSSSGGVDNKLTISYSEKSFTISELSNTTVTLSSIVVNFSVGEPAPTLNSIEVSGTPDKTVYEIGESFNPKGLVVTGTYSDGNTDTITDGIDWDFDPNVFDEAGDNISVDVMASVEGIDSDVFTVEGIRVNAPATLESIAISGEPDKMVYELNQSFDVKGLVVTGTYSDKSTKEITEGIEWLIDPETFEEPGENISVDVMASVEGIDSDVFTVEGIKVNAPVTFDSITVKTNPSTSYYVGDCFNPKGLVITKHFSDQSTEDVSYSGNENLFSFNPDLNTPLAKENTTIEITYDDKYVDLDITVTNEPQYACVYDVDTTTLRGQTAYAQLNEIKDKDSKVVWEGRGNTNNTDSTSKLPTAWRIGGKDTSTVDREFFTRFAVTDNVTKIELDLGSFDSSITMNSLKVETSKTLKDGKPDFTNPYDSVTLSSFEDSLAESTLIIRKSGTLDWSNCYIKIIFNITLTNSSNNKCFELTNIRFYRVADPKVTLDYTQIETSVDAEEVVITATPEYFGEDVTFTWRIKEGETTNQITITPNPEDNSKATIQFVEVGSTILECYVVDGDGGSDTAYCSITVNQAVKSVLFDENNEATLQKNTYDSKSYIALPTVSVYPQTISQTVNTSFVEGKDVAEIKGNRIYILKAGTAVITFTSELDSTKYATLTVNVGEDYVEEIQLKEGSTFAKQYVNEKFDSTGLKFEKKYHYNNTSWYALKDDETISFSETPLGKNTTSVTATYDPNPTVKVDVTGFSVYNWRHVYEGSSVEKVIDFSNCEKLAQTTALSVEQFNNLYDANLPKATSVSNLFLENDGEIRVATSSKVGSLVIKADDIISKAVVTAKGYNTSETNLTVWGDKKEKISTSFADYEFIPTSTEETEFSLTTGSDKDRTIIQKIVLTVGAAVDIGKTDSCLNIEKFIDEKLNCQEFDFEKMLASYNGTAVGEGEINLTDGERALFVSNEAYATEKASLLIKADENGYQMNSTNNKLEYKELTVTYDANGGEGAPTDKNTYHVGQKVTVSSSEPTREGYTFAGWKLGNDVVGETFTMPASNATLVAQWSINSHKVSYDGVTTQDDVPFGTEIDVAAAPEEQRGKTFLGWSYNSTLYQPGDKLSMPDEDVNFVASWQDKEALSVTYNTNGGSEVKDENVYYAGETVTLAAKPTKEHYDFLCWEVNGKNKNPGETFTIEENTTVNAVWVMKIGDINVNTQANFRYTLDANGKVTSVSNTSLRMYVELDEVSYKYYTTAGYVFSINMVNESNKKVANLEDLPVVHDEERGVWVFDIAVNVPAENLDTNLTISLVAKKGAESVNTNTVTVSFNQTAQELYEAYGRGEVMLTSQQLDALKMILKIN